MPTITPIATPDQVNQAPISRNPPKEITASTQSKQGDRDKYMAALERLSSSDKPITQDLTTGPLDKSDIKDLSTQNSDTTTPAETPSPKVEETDPRIASMAKREKAAWDQIKQLKAEKASLEASQAKAAEGKLSKEEFIRQLQADPTSLGLTYDQIGQMYLAKDQPVDPSIAQMRAELAALRAEQEAFKTSQASSSQQAYQEALRQIDHEAKTLVERDNSYEVIRSQGAAGAVTSLIELTYKETGVLMDVREAAAQVEAHLEQEALTLFSKSEKLKAKLRTPAEGTTQAPATKTPNTPQTHRTLTREVATNSTKLSSRERALLAFEGKLK